MSDDTINLTHFSYCSAVNVSMCRKAEIFRTCVNNIACSSSTVDRHLYVSYQSLVGISLGDEYLCSAAARPGIYCTTGVKNTTRQSCRITSQSVNRFSKYFHCWTRHKRQNSISTVELRVNSRPICAPEICQ